MSLTINLLGRPYVERDGHRVPPPRGRKAWAVLLYLVTNDRPPARDELVSMLFPEADDPFRALRWNLTELRRLLGGCVSSSTTAVTLDLPAGTTVDLRVVTRGSWAAALDLPGLGREPLEGMDIAASAAFESWLLNERRHLLAATEAVLREAAFALAAAGRHERAIAVATRLVTLDPLNEGHQEVLVRCYTGAGARDAASAQVASYTKLLRRELGVDPGPQLAAALEADPTSSTAPPSGGWAAARAQLEAGQAAIKAGSYDVGVRYLRRAVAEAHDCGDIPLKAATVLGLGSALAHSGRALVEEASASLHEAIKLGGLVSDQDICTQARLDLAWLEFLGARYDRALAWLQLAREHATAPSAKSYAAWIEGKVATERANYPEARRWLHRARDLAAKSGQPGLHAFTQASLGRLQLLTGESHAALGTLESSAAGFRGAGWTLWVACPEAFRAEALLAVGRIDEASETAQFAHALALEVQDTMLDSLAGRSLALVALARGEERRALEQLEEAYMTLVRTPAYAWAMAYALETLCAVGVRTRHPRATAWVLDLETVAGRTGMKELLARAYLHRHSLGDPTALSIARSLASQIDNPALEAAIPAEVGAIG